MKSKRKGKNIDQPNAEIKKSKVSVVGEQKAIVPSSLADHVDGDPTTELQRSINRAATGVPEEKNEKEKHLSGFIFMCNRNTKLECYRYRVFGLPLGKKEVVEEIKPGAKLFLFDFELKLLYGIYEATTTGKLNLEPAAFMGRFPAQVENLSSSLRPLDALSLSRPLPLVQANASLSQAMPTGPLSMHAGRMSAKDVPYVADTHHLRIPPSMGPRYDPKANILAYGHSGASGQVEHVNPTLDLQNLARLCNYYVNVAKSQQPAVPERVANGARETSYSSYRTPEERPIHDQISSLEMRYRAQQEIPPHNQVTSLEMRYLPTKLVPFCFYNLPLFFVLLSLLINVRHSLNFKYCFYSYRTTEERPPGDQATSLETRHPTVDGTDPHKQYYHPPMQGDPSAVYQENLASYNPTAPSLYTSTSSAVQPQVIPSPYQPLPLQAAPQYQDSAVAYNPNPPAQPTQYTAPPVIYADSYYAPSTSTQPQALWGQESAAAYNTNPSAQSTQYRAPPVMYADSYYAAAYAQSTQPQQVGVSQVGAPINYSYYPYGTTG
ncbi:DCD (Development and Cell Death) domain protein [Striga asiatica]|uniref:DCD (Development and Cell Death) domain protein n=1 Tax=Striga asiatica TaxID=4170 RepID=A0A5A7QM90_STRAF|nr:DCD (Development and Cell Death) domain protein [Striga asiatica]